VVPLSKDFKIGKSLKNKAFQGFSFSRKPTIFSKHAKKAWDIHVPLRGTGMPLEETL
jgi:hypothetical protein